MKSVFCHQLLPSWQKVANFECTKKPPFCYDSWCLFYFEILSSFLGYKTKIGSRNREDVVHPMVVDGEEVEGHPGGKGHREKPPGEKFSLGWRVNSTLLDSQSRQQSPDGSCSTLLPPSPCCPPPCPPPPPQWAAPHPSSPSSSSACRQCGRTVPPYPLSLSLQPLRYNAAVVEGWRPVLSAQPAIMIGYSWRVDTVQVWCTSCQKVCTQNSFVIWKFLLVILWGIKKLFFSFSKKTETPPPPFLTTSVFLIKFFWIGQHWKTGQKTQFLVKNGQKNSVFGQIW